MRRLSLLPAILLSVGLAAAPVRAQDPAVAPAGDTAPVLVVGLDLSKSNPMVSSDAYARRVADRVAPMVEALPLRGRVMVRSFGSYDATSNTLRIDQILTARSKPEDFARGLKTLISGVPKLVRDGKLTAQNKTNILPFLQTMSQVVDCKAGPVTFVLLTDGVEDSEYARLQNARATLPAPSHDRFRGCSELQILGLGQGLNSPKATERLRVTWASWAAAAGFDRFSGFYDW
jgi:hypothetical protein